MCKCGVTLHIPQASWRSACKSEPGGKLRSVVMLAGKLKVMDFFPHEATSTKNVIVKLYSGKKNSIHSHPEQR